MTLWPFRMVLIYSGWRKLVVGKRLWLRRIEVNGTVIEAVKVAVEEKKGFLLINFENDEDINKFAPINQE